jgi:uncharacterized protein (TIGR02246 family)
MNIRKSICLATVFAATFTFSAQTPAPNNVVKSADPSAQEIAAIIALEQRDAAAAKVNDVETLVSLWTEDGVLLQPRSEPVVGLAAIRQLLEQQKKQSAMIVTLAYLENWKERRILGDEAYEWGEISVTAKLPDTKQASQTVLAIRVLRRQQDGSWKVARAIITPGPQKN